MPARKILAYVAIYVFWGGSFLAIREIVAVTPPFFAAGFRFFTAGVLLLLYSYMRGGVTLSRRNWASAALLGLVMFAVEYACLFWAEQRISSGIASVISATIPVWIFLGEVVILRSLRPTAKSLSGVVLGFAGILLLTWQQGKPGGGASVAATLVALAGALCWSSGTLLSRRLSLPKPQTASAGWQMAVGGVLLLVLSCVAGESHRLPAALAAWNLRIAVSMLYLIFVASVLAFTAYIWLLGHEPMARVASYAYVNPVVALAIGALLGGEHLTLQQMAGSALVVAGVFATLTGKQPATVTATSIPRKPAFD
jgi:drug/metabolite transporter (DMT)-like permease